MKTFPGLTWVNFLVVWDGCEMMMLAIKHTVAGPDHMVDILSRSPT